MKGTLLVEMRNSVLLQGERGEDGEVELCKLSSRAPSAAVKSACFPNLPNKS